MFSQEKRTLATLLLNVKGSISSEEVFLVPPDKWCERKVTHKRYWKSHYFRWNSWHNPNGIYLFQRDHIGTKNKQQFLPAPKSLLERRWDLGAHWLCSGLKEHCAFLITHLGCQIAGDGTAYKHDALVFLSQTPRRNGSCFFPLFSSIIFITYFSNLND